MLPAAAGLGAGTRPSRRSVPAAAAPSRGAHARVEPSAPGTRLGDAAVVHGRFPARAASQQHAAAAVAPAGDATATTTAATATTVRATKRAACVEPPARTFVGAWAAAGTAAASATARTAIVAAARAGLPPRSILESRPATTATVYAQLRRSARTVERARTVFCEHQWRSLLRPPPSVSAAPIHRARNDVLQQRQRRRRRRT